MRTLPRISVVTSSYNQGKFLGRTIDSVLAQNYPNLEHIVVDGMSTDETPDVLARYPHLRVIREPDSGQSEAINKGFRSATGEIYCFLNSDDTLLPGALDRVAQEIDPAQGRHIVMGRCRYIDEHDRPSGIEHPCAFVGHRRVLEVWKTHCIPQPSTFWTAEAWRRCGPLDEKENLVLDYDLMCHFSRLYSFHFIDQVLATYRLHRESKSCSHSAETVCERAIRVSQRYWGSRLQLQYWQLCWSLAQYRLIQWLRGKSINTATMSSACSGFRKRLCTVVRLGATVSSAPAIAIRRMLPLKFARLLQVTLSRGRSEPDGWQRDKVSPITMAFRDFTRMHEGNWIGPKFVARVSIERRHRWLHVDGAGVIEGVPQPLEIKLFIDGRIILRQQIDVHRPFSIAVPLMGVEPGNRELTVISNTYIVPHEYLGNGDYRPLSLRVDRLLFTEGA